MTHENRKQKIESFRCATAILAAALREFPKKMWLYKPEQDRWSIHEIILHLADSEAFGYIRCRRLIAEPGQPVLKYDAQRWAGALGYFYQSTKEALELIRRLRLMTYQLLLAVPEPVWMNTVAHPLEGQISLDHWLDLQERHIPHHIEQMKQNHTAWAATHPPRKPATPRPRGLAVGSKPLITLNATL